MLSKFFSRTFYLSITLNNYSNYIASESTSSTLLLATLAFRSSFCKRRTVRLRGLVSHIEAKLTFWLESAVCSSYCLCSFSCSVFRMLSRRYRSWFKCFTFYTSISVLSRYSKVACIFTDRTGLQSLPISPTDSVIWLFFFLSFVYSRSWTSLYATVSFASIVLTDYVKCVPA